MAGPRNSRPWCIISHGAYLTPSTTASTRSGRACGGLGISTDTLADASAFAISDPPPADFGLTLQDIHNPPSLSEDPRAVARAPGAATKVLRAQSQAEERGIVGGRVFPQGLTQGESGTLHCHAMPLPQ